MITRDGLMFVEEEDIIELMLANRRVKILPSNKDNFNKFEKECKSYGLEVPFAVASSEPATKWNMPEDFKNLCIEQFIKVKHPKLTTAQWQRVHYELAEFERRDLNDLLKFLCYFISVLKEHDVIYGVGRGSSIASYVLFLIGVHRIDSFKFNLDIKEFLK